MNVSGLSIYPLKSAAGIALEEVEVEARGLAGDRRWLVAGEDGTAITQRDLPRLALVEVETMGNGIRLRGPGAEGLAILPEGRSRLTVEVWGQAVDAADAGEAAAAWLARFLGVKARLAHMDGRSERVVSLEAAGRAWPVSFADELPILVLGEGSLEELNSRLPVPVGMDRFRPNVVVRGGEPFDEDLWSRIAIGEMELELVKPCSRCVLTTVDQATGVKAADGEPMRTLATFRRSTRGAYPHQDGRVYFGWRAAALGPGRLRVGDEVRVVERRGTYA